MYELQNAPSPFPQFNIREETKKIINKIKYILEDRRVQQASLTISAINILVAADPVMASLKLEYKVLRTMFPLEKNGHKICYGGGCDKCPTHGCNVYPVEDDETIAWCPLCLSFVSRPYLIKVYN